MVNRWSILPLWVRLSAFFLAGCCALGVLELWAQEQRPQLPGWGGPSGAAGLMASHPTRLWGMSSGMKSTAEGCAAKNNELGFHGPLPVRPKPADRLRVISLGDSSFYGFGVNDHETFDVQLASALRANSLDVDSVNAGVAGYSIAQHRVAMDEVIWDLEPNLLVLCNVWSDNTWDTFQDEDLLVSARFARKNPLTRSALVKVFAAWWGGQQSADGGRIIVWNGAEGWPEGKVRRVPLTRWVQLHQELLVQAAERGVGVVFLKPTNSFLLSPSKAGPPPAWHPYFEAMDALAEHHNVPVVDVTEAYRAAMESGAAATDLLWDKMHPTARGHQVLAEAIESALQKEDWPKAALVPSGTPLPELNVQDMPSPEWTDDAGAGSPQVSLFALTEDEKSAMQQARKALEAQGPPEPEGVEPLGTGAQPMNQQPQAATWAVEISLAGGTPPYSVRLLDERDRVVGSARVSEGKTFRLKVRQDVQIVQVEVKDGSGEVTVYSATPSAAVVVHGSGE